MMRDFLRDASHEPARQARVAMATQHDQIEVMCVHRREHGGGRLAQDHFSFGVYVDETASCGDAVQVVPGLFTGSLNVLLYWEGFERYIGHQRIGDAHD